MARGKRAEGGAVCVQTGALVARRSKRWRLYGILPASAVPASCPPAKVAPDASMISRIPVAARLVPSVSPRALHECGRRDGTRRLRRRNSRGRRSRARHKLGRCGHPRRLHSQRRSCGRHDRCSRTEYACRLGQTVDEQQARSHATSWCWYPHRICAVSVQRDLVRAAVRFQRQWCIRSVGSGPRWTTDRGCGLFVYV